MNADPRVMEFMSSLLSRDESDALIGHIESHFRERGFGLCAVELRQDHSFIGYVGLAVPRFRAVSLRASKSDGDLVGLDGFIEIRNPQTGEAYKSIIFEARTAPAHSA